MDHENRRLEQKVEILKEANDICESIIDLYSFSTRKEKIDQVITVILCKLARKDSFSLVYFKHESLRHHHVSKLDFRNADSLTSGEVKF